MAQPSYNMPNLAAGFKNMPYAQGPSIPAPFPVQTMPPQIQPVQMAPAPVQSIVPAVGGDTSTYNIFGQVIQKKYVYILLFIAAVAVGYMIYKWYYGKSKTEDEDDEDDEINDNHLGLTSLGFPPFMNPNPFMQPPRHEGPMKDREHKGKEEDADPTLQDI